MGHIKTYICILEKWHIVRKYKMAVTFYENLKMYIDSHIM